jgi:hypothetical protein
MSAAGEIEGEAAMSRRKLHTTGVWLYLHKRPVVQLTHDDCVRAQMANCLAKLPMPIDQIARVFNHPVEVVAKLAGSDNDGG